MVDTSFSEEWKRMGTLFPVLKFSCILTGTEPSFWQLNKSKTNRQKEIVNKSNFKKYVYYTLGGNNMSKIQEVATAVERGKSKNYGKTYWEKIINKMK